jgi:uncharacterized Zn finger protein
MAFWGFPRYVSVGEKKARAARKLEKLKKKRDVKPVVLDGHAIARTWWGKAWNQNLERYADYANRIGRGRSYVRHGAVLDLQVREGEVIALVQGSRAAPYEIIITIKKLNKDAWKAITASCEGMIDSLQELIEGKFPKALSELFMRQGTGLFPTPKEISLKCSCPDWATMCKHVAAALYGVGARLDEDPALFFTLRGVAVADLVGKTAARKAEGLLEKAAKKSTRIIDDADLSGMFGIELAGAVGPSGPDGDAISDTSTNSGNRKVKARKAVKSRSKKKSGSASAAKPAKKAAKKKKAVKHGAKDATSTSVKKKTTAGQTTRKRRAR